MAGMAAAAIEDIINNLNDYSDYEELESVSRAKSYVTAAKRFLSLPQRNKDQFNETEFNQVFIERQLKHARAFVAANDTSRTSDVGPVYLGSGSDFRS